MKKISLRKFVLSFVLAACGFTACSADKDNDGVIDSADLCMTVSAGRTPDPARPGCPATDSDRDGILDNADVCPGMPVGNGIEADPNRAGCPAPVVIPTPPTPPPVLPNGQDHDGDGVVNETDQCPTVAVGNDPDPSRLGCPDGDGDNDGVKDHADRCPVVASTDVNDPDGDGCSNPDRDGDGVIDSADLCPDLPETSPDAGTSADGGSDGAVETDASATDAGTHYPGCPAGHEPTVTIDGGTVEADATVTNIDPDGGAVQAADASVTATSDVVPGNGNTTVIVQVTPPTPAPAPVEPTPAPVTPSESAVSGLAVGTLIEAASGRPAANAFCWVSRRDVQYALSHPANANCRRHEASCWRRASDDTQITDCGNAPTPGCRASNGMVFACESGAQTVIVRRCAQTTVPCTAQNLADAWRSRRSSR